MTLKSPADWFGWLQSFTDDTGGIARDRIPALSRALAEYTKRPPMTADEIKNSNTLEAQLAAREAMRVREG